MMSTVIAHHQILPFEPHPLFSGGHAQTLAGAYLPGKSFPYQARQHRVILADGDQLVLHDDCPPRWQSTNPTVMLIHGLSGSYQSSYMQRLAGKFCERGVRAFRLDLRGAGAGTKLARLTYHSGRSDDAAAALQQIAQLCPASPTTVIGFSLGGNITLKLLGELGESDCGNLQHAVAVSPPIELGTCCRQLQARKNQLYDRHFVRGLFRQYQYRIRTVPGAARVPLARKPKSLLEFDEQLTAPLNGFDTADTYYRECSSAAFLPAIRKPTLVLTAADDPLIPLEMFSRLQWPTQVLLHVAPGGGHLGFISRGGRDPDRRWMDWRILEWVLRGG